MTDGQRGLRELLSPERIAFGATLLLVALVVALGTLGGPAKATAPSPTDSAAAFASPTASPLPDAALVAGAIDFNDRLRQLQESLRGELAAPSLDSSAVVAQLRQVDTDVRAATEVATRMAQFPATAAVAADLAASYVQLQSVTQDALRTSPRDSQALRLAGGRVVAALGALAPLTTRLRDLLGPVPSATASTTASPGSGFVNQLTDPGFEQAAGGPWRLQLASGAWATITSDPALKVAGATSARVDVGTPSTSWAGIAVVQPGLQISAGGRYAISIALRADQARDVRLRIVSQQGDTYATRLVTIGPTWSTATFEFTALVPDGNAIFEIDLGRATPSVWLDSAAFGQLASPSP